MKISGERIKARRKLIGLSQSELADEICTQATISLIEKKNKVPSMEILISICDRLELSIDSVIIEDSNLVSGILKNAEKNLHASDLNELKENIDKIDEKKLVNNQELRQYYYFKAYLELKLNKNYDKAIFIYTRAFNATSRVNDIYDVLINLFISEAYLAKDALEEAQIYADQAEMIIQSNNFEKNGFSINRVLIFKNISEIFIKLGNNKKALSYAKQGIVESNKRESYFLLDNFYITLAQLENDKFAAMAAYVISSIRNNDNINQQAKKITNELNIELN
ncbi:transcriptional regulator [Companilactobacillus sp. RD055328]|uniref:helix-turn-helix domain-containing protein n=1 Tax=Companilactobacillus sp. RD055328 TaxID=2916634 RepID=UPI001FC8270E|nr:helix-turn-helix transcriptional regulator [Companilactobacillus sp. RD055328]GKQ42871.1 transcriptional regulator [Companilactobacillus sp. RD055328]